MRNWLPLDVYLAIPAQIWKTNAGCLIGKYNLDMLILTCGINGSYVFAPNTESYQKTPIVDIADTVGAGDSFTGTFCFGYS